MLSEAGVFAQQSIASGPAAPNVVSITPTEVGSGTSHAISLGATVASGDLLIIFAASDGGAGDEPDTAAANWSKIESFSNGASGGAVFKKLAAGTEGGTTIDITTASNEAVAAQCFRVSSWSGNIADVAVAATPTTGTDDTAECPQLTSGFGAVPTLWICGVGTSAAVTLNSGPGNYTVTDTGTISIANGQIRTGWRRLTAASETPGAFTLSGPTTWSATTIAIRGQT